MLKADDDDDDDSTFPSLFCEVVVVEPPPRSFTSPRSSSTSFLPPTPGTNAGAFAFMILYLCVYLRSDWNEVTGLPLGKSQDFFHYLYYYYHCYCDG